MGVCSAPLPPPPTTLPAVFWAPNLAHPFPPLHPLRNNKQTTTTKQVDPSPLYRPGSPSLNVFKSAANLTSGEIKDPGYNASFAPALTAWMQAAGALLQSKLASVMMDPAQLVNTTSRFRADIPDAGLVTPDNSLWLMSVDGRWDDETNQNPWCALGFLFDFFVFFVCDGGRLGVGARRAARYLLSFLNTLQATLSLSLHRIYKQSFNQTTASQFTNGRVEDPAGGVMIGINFTTGVLCFALLCCCCCVALSGRNTCPSTHK